MMPRRHTKLQTIFKLMRRKRGVSRHEIWNRTHAYKHFSMDKLVAPHGVKYRKHRVDGYMRYYAK